MDQRPKRRLTKRDRRRSTNVFSGISQAKIQILREAFAIIDQDRDGAVSQQDLRRIFTSLGETISDAVIEEMLAEIPGTLNFTSFLGMFAHMTSSLDTEEVVANAFSLLDNEGKGHIDAGDFIGLLAAVGPERYDQEEINTLMRKAPVDKHGRLSIDSMAKMLTFQEDFSGDL